METLGTYQNCRLPLHCRSIILKQIGEYSIVDKIMINDSGSYINNNIALCALVPMCPICCNDQGISGSIPNRYEIVIEIIIWHILINFFYKTKHTSLCLLQCSYYKFHFELREKRELCFIPKF